jgi:hypothetical protein
VIETTQTCADGKLIQAVEMCDVVSVVAVSNFVPRIDVPISRRPASM